MAPAGRRREGRYRSGGRAGTLLPGALSARAGSKAKTSMQCSRGAGQAPGCVALTHLLLVKQQDSNGMLCARGAAATAQLGRPPPPVNMQ